jgi:hypothetical protein
MSYSLEPSDALSPEAFYSLYLGGLAVEDERARLETSYILLTLGRLGLEPDELLHLHEGWIDWTRGEIHVPARDPCACGACWDDARLRQRRGDDRDLPTIVATDCWSPPANPRCLAFGWSKRLAGAIHGVLASGLHYESTHETVRRHIETAAANARHIDPDTVSVRALRASALVFLASAGFGPRRLVDLTGVDEQTAGDFARVGGGAVRNHLYRALADETAPSLCGDETPYDLVCDDESFTREPFDPAEYDTEWRSGRAEQSGRPAQNPRPIDPPDGISFDDSDFKRVNGSPDESVTAAVADSLRSWVDQGADVKTPTADDPSRDGEDDQQLDTDDNTGDTATEQSDDSKAADAAEGDADETTDVRSEITEPTEFSVDTRLVAPNFEGGRPTGGSIVLGQHELVFLSRGVEGISETLRVELDWIANLAPGYVPEQLEGLFEETVGIAYRDEDDERRVIVVEIPSDIRWQFIQTIFAKILDGQSAVVTHRPEEPSSTGPEERLMDAETATLLFEGPGEHDRPIRLRLNLLLDIEEGRMTGEDGYEYGLKVHHLGSTGNPRVSEVRPTTEETKSILKRYLVHYDNRQTNKVRTATLDGAEIEILQNLYENGGGRDLSAMLDKDQETLSTALKRLSDLDVVISGSGGKRLTGVGYRVVSPKYEL